MFEAGWPGVCSVLLALTGLAPGMLLAQSGNAAGLEGTEARRGIADGYRVAGLEDRTGSLTPDKRADVVALDATALNMAPVHDAIAAVTLGADVSNVETVIVDGVVHKRDGRLLADVGRARRLVEESRDRLLAAVAAKKSGT